MGMVLLFDMDDFENMITQMPKIKFDDTNGNVFSPRAISLIPFHAEFVNISK